MRIDDKRIAERCRRPRCKGFEGAYDGAATGENPFCGDALEVRVALERRACGLAVARASFEGYACSLCTASADVLMERVPRGLDIADIHDDLAGAPGVDAVSDLHVWSLTPGIPLLCAHISLSGDVPAETVVRGLTAYIRSLGITHSTLQTHGDAPTHPDVAPH